MMVIEVCCVFIGTSTTALVLASAGYLQLLYGNNIRAKAVHRGEAIGWVRVLKDFLLEKILAIINDEPA